MFLQRCVPILLVLALIAAACTAERPTLAGDTSVPVASSTAPVDPVGVDGDRAEGAGNGFAQTTVAPADTAPPETLAGRAPQSTIEPAALPAADLPPVNQDGTVKALRTPTGVVVQVLQKLDDGYLVQTPCAIEATVSSGEELFGAHVVLDAGHGGVEPGAVGPAGTKESHVNLAIAERTQALLEEAGVVVISTRTADYRISIQARTGIANAVNPQAFVSIHHNAEPDGPFNGPGAETYYQIADDESKRLAALIYEEAVQAFSAYDIAWAGDTDAGVKFRPGSSGGDYYGILRRSNGVPATLTELAFLSNPPEEELLASQAFQQVEAEALAKAILRYLTTDDPGSGFVEPYPRTAPAGSGGGVSNCEDPAFE